MLAAAIRSALSADGAFTSPALDLRFDLGDVDAGITVTRASTRTCQGPLGLLDEVAANVLAIDYDPTTRHDSVTALTVGLGVKTLAVTGGSGFANGTPVRITSRSDPTKWMAGVVLRYLSGDLRVAVLRSGGSGSASDWVVIECLGASVWEQRTNLFSYSEQFQDASWTKNHVTIQPNAAVAHDGRLTMDKLVEGSGTVSPYILKDVSLTSGTTYTQTVYAKAGERTVLQLTESTGFPGTGSHYQNYDLSNGTLASKNGDAVTRITHVGGGIYRCEYTKAASATGAGRIIIAVVSSTTSGRLAGYTGDGTSGLYIWGAQLEAGAFATPYIPTKATFTSRASTATYFDSTGVLQTAGVDVARYGYGLVDGVWVSKGLEIEAAATNLLTYSGDPTNAAWSTVGLASINAGYSAPDGSIAAVKTVEDTSSGEHYRRTASISVTGSTTYTASIFVKAGERTKVQPTLTSATLWPNSQNPSAVFDLVTGEISSVTGSTTLARITECKDGWWRCELTATSATDASGSSQLAPLLHNGSTASYAGDGVSGLYIWGAQLETGSRATSYIPTTSAAVTRSEDVSSSSSVTRSADVAQMTGTNFSSWFSATEGTLLADARVPVTSSSYPRVATLGDGTFNNGIYLYLNGPSKKWGGAVIAGGASQADLFNVAGFVFSAGLVGRLALAYRVNDFEASVNGATTLTDAAGSVPTVDRLIVGGMTAGGNPLNGNVRRLRYYPKRHTGAHLQLVSAQP